MWLWAHTWAILYNAHFRGAQHPKPWTAAELMGEEPSASVTVEPRKVVNGVPVMSKDEIRFNLAAGGMLPDDEIPEWAKATVAASKAAGAVVAIDSHQSASHGFIFEDTPEGHEKKRQWMKEQARRK